MNFGENKRFEYLLFQNIQNNITGVSTFSSATSNFTAGDNWSY